MQTVLKLLTREGAVYMAFSPALNAEPYAELGELTHHPDTNGEMQAAVRVWAQGRGLKVSFDELDRGE